jgi:hypothetical protein
MAGELDFGIYDSGIFSSSWNFSRKFAIISNIGILVFEQDQYAGIPKRVFPFARISCQEEQVERKTIIVCRDLQKTILFGLKFDM